MRKSLIKFFLFLGATISLITTAVYGQENASLRNFPPGCSPKEVGKRIAEHFIATPHTNFGRPAPPRVITYPETCTWYGALTFAKVHSYRQPSIHFPDPRRMVHLAHGKKVRLVFAKSPDTLPFPLQPC